jgi:hypothetical protein
MHKNLVNAAFGGGAIVLVIAGIICCSSSAPEASSGSTSGRAINAYTSTLSTNNNCALLSRDTSSCNAARTAMGFTGNWLLFSCNVVLGLKTAGGATTTTFGSAAWVTITFTDLPDYASNYYPQTGTYSFTANSETVSGNYSTMYTAYTTAYPNPSYIAQQSMVLKVPITPSVSQTSTSGYSAVGVTLNGVAILDSMAANSDSIFAEAGSFDECQGHPNSQNGGTYHFHTEPYSISYNDNNLIGIMLDGYWIYGRKEFNGTTATPVGTDNLYTYGGHTGANPLDGTGNTFHYHVTEWTACYHETMAGGSVTYHSDDGSATCNLGGGGTSVTAYFLTGHGNGGVFRVPPTGPTNQTAAIRYFYGAPGTCTGC